jgi:hypothetical protein
MRIKLTRLFLLAAMGLLAAGCARPVSIQSDTRSVAAIEVRNELALSMLVYYQSGAEPRLLGAIAPRGTERFIVTAPSGSTVQVTARSQDGTRTVGPYSVTLQAGSTQPVVLR